MQQNFELFDFTLSAEEMAEIEALDGGESLFLLGQPMKMAAVMLAIIPIMCAYPFFQKYFTAGMTAGAVKG